MGLPVIDNRCARAIFMDRHGLARPRRRAGRGAALSELVTRLGFVQVDSVNTLARAHDMILFSRCTDYRPESLRWLNDRARKTFEGWTHDASVIPMEFFPYWREKFDRDAARLREKYTNWHGPAFQAELAGVLDHIEGHGACCSRDVGEAPAEKSTGWWDWKPSKTALEYLWRSGRLAVSHRKGFAKFYDLVERVVPAPFFADRPARQEVVDWAAAAALDRLGFATAGEIAAFFALITPTEAREWATRVLAEGQIQEAEILGADKKPRVCLTRPETLASDPPAIGSGLRLLSPFDPMLRDRKRAAWLFGFDYRIEIFVPEAQRKFGYYVFPILEGSRLVGRVDMQSERRAGQVTVRALWPEKRVTFGPGRMARLEAEFSRAARFAGCDTVEIGQDFLRSA